jgi:hypothetical protein
MTTATAPLPYLERRPGGFLYRRRIPGRAASVQPAPDPVPTRAPAPQEKISASFASNPRPLRSEDPGVAPHGALRPGLRPGDGASDGPPAARSDRDARSAGAIPDRRACGGARRGARAVGSRRPPGRRLRAGDPGGPAARPRDGDRELARQPLREVAACLGIALLEDTEDWNRLAFEATRVLLDASRLREREELGEFDEPSPVFRTARARMEGAVRPPGRGRADPSPPPHRALHRQPVALPIGQWLPLSAPHRPRPTAAGTRASPREAHGLRSGGRRVVAACFAGPDRSQPPRSPENPAHDLLALRLQMRPPQLDNLPRSIKLSPGSRRSCATSRAGSP